MTQTADTSTIPHYLTATVEYMLTEDIGMRKPSCMISRGDSDYLPGMLADLRAQGYTVFSVEIRAYCKACSGAGKLPDKRRKRVLYATVPCKACKGHDGPLMSRPFISDHGNAHLIDVMERK